MTARVDGDAATGPTYDYVVVGAGSAGATLAGRLTEDPATSVLLLEAGKADRAQNAHIPAAFSQLFRGELDWNYDTVPQRGLGNRSIYYPRGKMLGGSSSMNAMMWVPGQEDDFTRWADAAGPEWGWPSVSTYLQRITDWSEPGATRGRGGPQTISALRSPSPLTQAFLSAAVEAGYPKTTPDDADSGRPEGFCEAPVTQRRGRRWSTADAYLRPARRRRNLTVATESVVGRVRLDGTVATGVEYSRNGAPRTALARREVVLCAGAINTPQILMLSGIGPGTHLSGLGIDVRLDLPGVGSNLLDHLFAPIVVATRDVPTLFRAASPPQLLQYLGRRRGMLTSNVAEAFGLVRSGAAVRVPDLEIVFAPGPFLGEGLAVPEADAVTVGPVLLDPRSTGTVRLASADPAAPVLIDPAYLSDDGDTDRAILIRGIEIASMLLAQPSLARFVTGYVQPDARPGDDIAELLLERHAHTLYHPTSTCRMGSDADSVVDPQLRVRGIDRLRIADASVMPTIVRGHPAAAVMVIGERAADLLAGAR